MALSDAELFAIWDAPWTEHPDLTVRELEAMSLRAVADAAIADFSEEIMR